MLPPRHPVAADPIARGRGDPRPRHGPALSFQSLILDLQNFWARQGCVILQPYDVEVGAGTMAPETFLRVLGPKPYKVAYVQPSRRIRAKQFDLRDPAGIRDAYELGLKDGAAFANARP